MLKTCPAAIAAVLLIILAILVAGCSANRPVGDQSEGSPATDSTESDDVNNPELSATEISGDRDIERAPASTLDDGLALIYMDDLIGPSQQKAEDALLAITSAGDQRFVAVLIELLRGFQIGLVTHNLDIVGSLEGLSGQTYGADWPEWVAWYGGTSLQPPHGFTGWKGQLLSAIDQEFADFLRDGLPTRIRPEEIQWGGVVVDGIPPLENAPMISGSEANYLNINDPVFGLAIEGDARAYPLRIIDNHEMANDVIGGVPVSLAYCTLCGAAIAYEGRGPDDQTFTFGTSGFLYRSNKLMYDRQTRTLWNQLTGEPVLGKLADSDFRLNILPIVLSTWGEWRDRHPATLVLDNDTGIYPPDFYQPGVLYGEYFASSETMFPVWQRSDLLPDKEFVYTLFIDGIPKAYAVKALVEQRVVNDMVANTPVVLIAGDQEISVNGEHRFAGPVSYNHGGEVRAYERAGESFSLGPEQGTVIDSAGLVWQVTEDRLLGSEGEVLPRLSGHLAYWFGWYAFFPETLLYPDPRD